MFDEAPPDSVLHDRTDFDRGVPEFNDYLQRYADQSEQVAAHALIVDAKNSAARAFHAHHGFVAFANDHRRFFETVNS